MTTVTLPIDRPLDENAFEVALRGEERDYWDQHPFHRRMAAGELNAGQLSAWVANRWYYQNALPQKDAAVIANCPLPEVRRRWVRRIVYHDGTGDGDGGRAMWLTLAESVGLARQEVIDERHVVPGVRHAVDAYVAFARQRPWYEGVASSLTELFAPRAMAARMAAWRQHYPWIPSEGLGYFDDRVIRASTEGEDALQIVMCHCRSSAQQGAAVAAVRFKLGVLWGMVDAIDHATEAR
jgi:pyrroloquinoline-quinone synthase